MAKKVKISQVQGTENLLPIEKTPSIMEGNIFNASTGTSGLRRYENVAHYINNTTTNTGVLRVVIPIRTTTLWTLQLSIQERTTASISQVANTSLIIGGYNTTNSATYVNCNNPNIIEKVEYGRDSNDNTVLLIHKFSGTYSHPKVIIDWVQLMYSNNTDAFLKENYSIDFVAAENIESIDFTLTRTVLNSGFIRDSGVVLKNQVGSQSKLTSPLLTSVSGGSNTYCVIELNYQVLSASVWDIIIRETATSSSNTNRGSNYHFIIELRVSSVGSNANRSSVYCNNPDKISAVRITRVPETNNIVLIFEKTDGFQGSNLINIREIISGSSTATTPEFTVSFTDDISAYATGVNFPNANFVRDSYYLNWNNHINKPTSFPPSSHSHVLSEITGLVDALAGKVSTAQLVEQLSNYIPINGVSTINGTKTFTEAPIVPAGTLNGHAVNLGQLIEQLNGLVRTWHEVINAGSGSDAVTNRGVTITNTSTTNNQDIFSIFHFPNGSYDRFFRIQNVGGRLSFYTSQNQADGTGVDIAFFGYYALHALKRDVLNTAIAFNSAFGTNALRELEQGVGNSAFGNNAGRYVRLGDNNTFLGRSAGYSLNLNRLTGSNNTFIGALAGNGVGASSSGNTIIGVNTSTSTEIHNEVIICYGNGQVAFRKYNDGRVVIPTQTKETYVADSTGKAVVTKEILNSYIDIELNHYQLIEMATSGWDVKQEEFGINTSTHFVRIVPHKCEGTFISPNENALLRSVYLQKDNNKIVGWNWMTPDKYNSRRISSDYGAAQVSSEDPSGYEVSGNFKIACHTYSGGDSKTTFKMRIYYEIVDL